jgi:ketosteroid isomerase-like protein
MMSIPLEIVNEIYDEFEKGNFTKALSRVSRDVIWTERIPYYGTLTSHDEIVALFEQVVENFDWGMNFDHFVDGGDMVVAVGTYSWVTKPSSPTEPRTEARVCHVWWLGDDDLIARYEQFVDTIKALHIIQPKIKVRAGIDA